MEINNIREFGDPEPYHRSTKTLRWNNPELAEVTRLRLISDPGYPNWDVSYCWGRTRTGQPCRVTLPFSQLPKRGWKGEIVAYARREGVYAYGLGILDQDVVSFSQ
jgi:hypothetical protein